jgi:hypothetical protein
MEPTPVVPDAKPFVTVPAAAITGHWPTVRRTPSAQATHVVAVAVVRRQPEGGTGQRGLGPDDVLAGTCPGH